MSIAVITPLDLNLPWSSSRQDDVRFKRILMALLVLLLAICLVLPYVPVQKKQREQLEEIPPQLAKVLVKKKEEPKPKPVEPPKPKVEPKPEPKPEIKPEPKPEPKPAPKALPKPEPKPRAVAPKPENQAQAAAREKAAKSGLVAMQSELAAMRQGFTAAAVQTQSKSLSNAGSQSKVATPERFVIGNKAVATSGGINAGAISRDVGGGGKLAEHQAGKVNGAAAGVLGGTGASGKGAGSGGSAKGPGKGGGSAGRSEESIRLVLGQNKGALNAIYNRELRQNPTLQGKVVFKIVIEPSGVVSSCTVVSSDLGSVDLERKLAARLKMISFGAEPVGQTTTTWMVDFFPS